MSEKGRWLRNQIASYGAAIAIIVEQLNSSAAATVPEAPTPLVRIQSRSSSSDEWDPDELITQRSGQTYVLVWEHDDQVLSQGSIHPN